MIWYIIIGLDIVGFILFLFFIFKYKKKFSGVKHYEEIRDEITLRDEEPTLIEIEKRLKENLQC